MVSRHIQNKTIPDDWLDKVESFDIDSSPLSGVSKTIFKYIKKYILEEKNNSLGDSLSCSLIDYIFFGKPFTPYYDDLPIELIKDAMDELGGAKELEFTKKLHSIFVEFMTYKELAKDGYKITNFTREEGSCDLVMVKNEVEYNFEVKFKENDDIAIRRLYDILDGYSLLKEYEFIRNKFIKINLKVESINSCKKEILEEILEEIERFLTLKKGTFDGKYIQIYESKDKIKLSRDIKSSFDRLSKLMFDKTLESKSGARTLIEKLFIGDGKHITNMEKKSKITKNFIGCLSWSIPFHNDADFKVVELAFRELINLDFDLYVFLSKTGKEKEHHFIIKKK